MKTSFYIYRLEHRSGEYWSYEMRRDMQEVIPGLYLGPYSAAMKSKKEKLLQHAITHIVCIRQNIEAHFVKPNFTDSFKYLVVDIADSPTDNIIQHFPKVKQFVDECLDNDGKALIHGNAGISRSAALVIAYIMERFGLTYKDALQYVQSKRFCINPNDGFAKQLQEYEPIYRAKLTVVNGQPSKRKGNLKRTRDEVDDEEQEMHVENS
ncbi:PREDICTED: serine/threonine/tyrosine-interacting protein-like isoform X2 [Priapulus caudatus]|uniref:Serine/threonine/tyrosine-interacting protein-like isoform X2 n=1 Tax=Priapulus caudatus TaxID=37621 RepID=A0ABM1EHT1_PRICU|nr:PREDICTED: serine/threonine/tyrosine-interacting protein-like isoform X2 [Priapulus caudatus]